MTHPFGAHFVGGFDGPTVDRNLKKLIQKYEIGGLILFSRNIESPKQVRKLITDIRKLATAPLLIGVDQEGGPVARLKEPFTKLPPMAVVGEFYRRTRKLRPVREVGRILGSELRALGFNWDYVPVLDVHSNPKNPVIGKRAFSHDPITVAECAEALLRGLHAEGVLSCSKHFPGHGATSADSHLRLPILKDPARLLWKRDLIPYRKLIPKKLIPCLMTAHVRYPDLDPDHCATLSRNIIVDLLRIKLGYKGVVVSDDLWMKAISDRYGIAEAGLQFFEAGGDMAMICKDPESQMEAIEQLALASSRDRAMRVNLGEAIVRLKRMQKRFLWKQADQPSLDILGCKSHRAIVDAIVRIGTLTPTFR